MNLWQDFLSDSDGVKQSLVIEQGYEVEREGTVQVWAAKQGDNYAVRIAGFACLVGNTEIEQP